MGRRVNTSKEGDGPAPVIDAVQTVSTLFYIGSYLVPGNCFVRCGSLPFVSFSSNNYSKLGCKSSFKFLVPKDLPFLIMSIDNL